MTKLERAELVGQAHLINLEQLARLGGDLRSARLRRRLTQTQLGLMAGLARSTVSDLERGRGG
ncbi:MAG TPA: helix-turn-helix domain-containing protein, partial [Candidatus Limnocylindrales bacterium]